jgi:hypothetical protein
MAIMEEMTTIAAIDDEVCAKLQSESAEPGRLLKPHC